MIEQPESSELETVVLTGPHIMETTLEATYTSHLEDRTSPFLSPIPSGSKDTSTEAAPALLLTPDSMLSGGAIEQPCFQTPNSTMSGSKSIKTDVSAEKR